MGQEGEFHTLTGYRQLEGGEITEAMEDYLEMLTRHMMEKGYMRIGALAEQLHVRPSSASKMSARLRELDLIQFEKYGLITLTEKGLRLGRYLLWRHKVLNRFFCWLNGSENQLRQVERVEHFMEPETLRRLEALMEHLGVSEPAEPRDPSVSFP